MPRKKRKGSTARRIPTERETLQKIFAASRGPDAAGPSEEVRTLERDGDLLWVFGDANRHERRIQRVTPGGSDRLFWGTIAIACGAPGDVPGRDDANLRVLKKQYGSLRKARSDLDAFYQYYRPMVLGEPCIVGAIPGLGKCPGYFDHALRLDNPTVRQLRSGLSAIRRWVAVNQQDPEYTSFQLNFCFSGHGDVDEAGQPCVVLADGLLDARGLTSMLLSTIPAAEVSPAPCRLDLYLDCCHSGAIAHAVAGQLAEMQLKSLPGTRSTLGIGQVYCACLDDEEAFELQILSHSAFSFAFLNECSRKRPEGAETLNLGLRDVGWFTGGGQHPVLFDFTCRDGFAFKFPAQYHLNYPPQSARAQGEPPSPRLDIDPETLADDPIGECLRAARMLRNRCAPIEHLLNERPDERVPFSRDELLTNRRFPFL